MKKTQDISQEKQQLLRLNKLLKENEKRFHALVHVTADVIYRISPDWKEMQQLDGKNFLADKGTSERKWLQKYILPMDQQHVLAVINKAIQTKSVFELEHRVKRIDGSVGWAASRAVPILNEKGKISEWIGIAVDITEKKKADEALQAARYFAKQRQKQLEAITASTPDLVYVFDLEYKITYANAALLEMWGKKTMTGALGKKLRELGYEEWHAEMHEREIDQVIITKKPIRGEVSFPHAKLGVRIYDYIFTPILTASGDVEAIAGMTRDITDLKHAEENFKFLSDASKILSSSLDFQTTLNNIAALAVPVIADWCGVDMLGENGEIQQVAVAHKDPKKIAWAKKLRRANKPKMTDPHGVAKVIRTGKREYYPEVTDEFLRLASKTEAEYKLAKSVGFTSALIVPLISQEKGIGAISFITAETKRFYTKTDVAMAEELANRASIALENAGLYKTSQEAVTLRDDFISVASHELKTPVTSVKMFTQILKKHSEQIGDTRAINNLSKMDKQLNKLTELIYDLLNISKIQAGKMEFREEKFDFDKAIKEVLDVLQQTAEKHTIKVKGKTQTVIHGDAERIGQVINNLVSNAIKYSPKSDKIIVNLAKDSKNVYVSVQDFGIGMGKSHLNRIFERFYRVYDTTDKTFPGLGIGLYISSEIIKRHGGKLWVDSNIGKGSTFHFSLPIQSKKVTKRKGKK